MFSMNEFSEKRADNKVYATGKTIKKTNDT